MTTQLLPTDLAAREAGFDHALQQRSSGAQVWAPPRFLGFGRFIEQHWAAGWPAAGLLSDVQRLALWQAVIDDDPQTPPLLAPQATARLAMAAEDLMLDYRITVESTPYTLEQRLFQRWRRAVEARMADFAVMPASRLPEELLNAPPPTLTPTLKQDQGWGPLSPSQQTLWQHWQLTTPQPASAALPTVKIHPDRSGQFRAIAERILHTLDAQPEARILVAVEDLPQHRAALDAALTDSLAPWRHQPGLTDRLPWRWASAQPLRDTALAQGWLCLASLTLRPLPANEWQRLLLNPALLVGEAALAAAKLDARVLDAGWNQLRISDLLGLAAPSLHTPLAALASVLEQAPRSARPSQWQAHFLARLRAFRPLGANLANSHLFQLERHLFEASERLGQLDRLLGNISASAAAQWLGEVLATPFQPRVEHPQPILIGTPAQLLGIPATQLMLANVETTVRTPQANPLLPHALMRAAGVPDADPLLASARSDQQRAALLALAEHTEATMAAVDSQGQPQTVPAGAVLERPVTPARRLRELPAPTLPEDDPAPPLHPSEQLVASAATFERFLTAPLLTVIVDRLRSTPLPRRSRGVPPSLQGQLSHDALMHFWGQTKTLAALTSLAPNSLDANIGQAVDLAIQARLQARYFGNAWVALERRRLISQLQEWLGHEMRRTSPFEVIARETSLRAQWDQLPIHLRLDRADRVDSAEGPQVLLIDYKTGSEANPGGWKADALKQPQLPLYAVLARQLADYQPLGGIAFAHLKAGHPTLSARTAWASHLIDPAPGKRAPRAPDLSWPEQLAAWDFTLRDAATGLQEGCAGAEAARLTGHHAAYRQLLDPDVESDDDEVDA